MKQFSKISGYKIPQEEKVETTQINEEDLFKTKVLNLLENLLSVQTYGPIDRYLRAGNIKISGKEHFVEALMDLLKEKSLKEETKVLESLKSEIRDWEILDTKIDENKAEIKNLIIKERLRKSQSKIKSLFNSYGNELDLLMLKVDESCNKITDPEVAAMNSVAAKYLAKENKYPESTLIKISEKFHQKYKQLSK